MQLTLPFPPAPLSIPFRETQQGCSASIFKQALELEAIEWRCSRPEDSLPDASDHETLAQESKRLEAAGFQLRGGCSEFRLRVLRAKTPDFELQPALEELQAMLSEVGQATRPIPWNRFELRRMWFSVCLRSRIEPAVARALRRLGRGHDAPMQWRAIDNELWFCWRSCREHFPLSQTRFNEESLLQDSVFPEQMREWITGAVHDAIEAHETASLRIRGQKPPLWLVCASDELAAHSWRALSHEIGLWPRRPLRKLAAAPQLPAHERREWESGQEESEEEMQRAPLLAARQQKIA